MRGPIKFWWLSQTVRFLFLLLMLLSVVVYFLNCVLETSLLRSYLHPKNATKAIYAKTSSEWFKKRPVTTTEDKFKAENVTYYRNTVKKYFKKTNNSKEQILMNTPINIAKRNNVSIVTFKSKEKAMNKTIKRRKTKLPLCPLVAPGLGPVTVDISNVYIDYIEKKFPEIKLGGHYSPPNCTSRYKVAIIVPYRNREQHLPIFLHHMHPFLMKQRLEYGIFVVEQYGIGLFNRAKLMNIGFVESQKLKAGGWHCFIFHDIDLLPQDQRNLYDCPELPRHMSLLIDKYDYKENICFGGVIAMTEKQFRRVNGFSNRYWGWGGEDDDMLRRVSKVYNGFTRYQSTEIGKYVSLMHEEYFKNPFRFELLKQTTITMKHDGLSTLKYKVVSIVKHQLYTHITVYVDESTAWHYTLQQGPRPPTLV